MKSPEILAAAALILALGACHRDGNHQKVDQGPKVDVPSTPAAEAPEPGTMAAEAIGSDHASSEETPMTPPDKKRQ